MPILTNQRHERFAQALVEGRSATDAYVEAGYGRSDSAASRLSRNDKVIARVREMQSEAEERAVLTREWVLLRLMRNVERAMQAVSAVRGGEPTGEYAYDGAAANRALELLGKELGMFVDRSETRAAVSDASDTPLTAEEWAVQHGRLQ